MAGINRLGKAAPKPGSLRPPDPNRRQDLDLFSEGAETDADYMRMVHDIEDTQQNQSGWLFGRGAFDKGDLLYLRDEEEKRRFTEMELRDSERQQFMKERARIEAERAAAALRAAQARKDKAGRQAPKSALNSVRIKPSNAHNSSSSEQGEPPTKKLKPDQDDRGPHETAESMQPAAAASKPISNETERRPASVPPQPSLTDMLGNYASDTDEGDSDHDYKDQVDNG
ncbi:hypothetical protein WJX79_005049 [Trebouxia sp. C0005]|nr:MAG: hypothetical protein FRX49_06277 [Trebouxia sp. A1-2]